MAESTSEFEVVIDGEYGTTDGAIYLLVDGSEVVMWDSAEWAEDPSLVYVIANAISKGFQGTLTDVEGTGEETRNALQDHHNKEN